MIRQTIFRISSDFFRQLIPSIHVCFYSEWIGAYKWQERSSWKWTVPSRNLGTCIARIVNLALVCPERGKGKSTVLLKNSDLGATKILFFFHFFFHIFSSFIAFENWGGARAVSCFKLQSIFEIQFKSSSDIDSRAWMPWGKRMTVPRRSQSIKIDTDILIDKSV